MSVEIIGVKDIPQNTPVVVHRNLVAVIRAKFQDVNKKFFDANRLGDDSQYIFYEGYMEALEWMLEILGEPATPTPPADDDGKAT